MVGILDAYYVYVNVRHLSQNVSDRSNLILNSLGIGITLCCVRDSSADEYQNDYQVVIARETVDDRNLEAHEANLFDLAAKHADVQSVEEIVIFLRGL